MFQCVLIISNNWYTPAGAEWRSLIHLRGGWTRPAPYPSDYGSAAQGVIYPCGGWPRPAPCPVRSSGKGLRIDLDIADLIRIETRRPDSIRIETRAITISCIRMVGPSRALASSEQSVKERRRKRIRATGPHTMGTAQRARVTGGVSFLKL